MTNILALTRFSGPGFLFFSLTESGVVFVTLEDQTGQINLAVWPWVAERQRQKVMHAHLLIASGTVERDGEVVHLIAGRLEDHSRLPKKRQTRSRDFK